MFATFLSSIFIGPAEEDENDDQINENDDGSDYEDSDEEPYDENNDDAALEGNSMCL